MSEDDKQNLNLTDEEIKQFEQLEREIKAAGGVEGLETAKLDIGAICEQYRKFRGILETVLPIIGKIPKVGKQVAMAIRFLMMIADLVCPAE